MYTVAGLAVLPPTHFKRNKASQKVVSLIKVPTSKLCYKIETLRLASKNWNVSNVAYILVFHIQSVVCRSYNIWAE